MKNRSLKYLLLIIPFCLFSRKLFAQIPPNPGDDPIKADSAKYIVSLKAAENRQLISQPNIFISKKDKDSDNKTSENVQAIKNKDKEGQ